MSDRRNGFLSNVAHLNTKRSKSSVDMVIEGYIYDVTYRIRNERPVVIMSIKRMDGVVEDVEFYGMRAYCFLRYSTFVDVDRTIDTLEGFDGVTECILDERSDYGGAGISLIKVYVTNPKKVPELRDKFLDVNGIISWEEADIPFVLRFIIDYDIYLCRRMKMNIIRRYGSSYIENISNNIEYIGGLEPIDFSYVSFDIETWNKEINTRPERDKVLMIAMTGKNNKGEKSKELFSLSDFGGSEIFKEKRMLGSFMDSVDSINPDLMITYNGTRYDYDYLFYRCKFLNMVLSLGRGKSPVFVREDSKYGKSVYLPGRVNYDLYPIAKRDIGDLAHKTLKNVADYVGVLKHEERVELPYSRIWKWWEAGGMRREIIKWYCMDDTVATEKLGMKAFIHNMIALSYITRVPLSMAVYQTYGFLNTNVISRYLYKNKMLIPKKDLTIGEDLKGAEVLPGKRGIFERLECWDFKSMYPSIVIANNISFETYVQPGEDISDDLCHVIGNGDRFRKEPIGILPKIEKKYLEARAEYKRIWKSKTDNDPDKGLYEALQLTYKRLANSVYGMTAQRAHASRFYYFPIASAITYFGRKSILAIAKLAEEEFGCDVVYGDTDSIYTTKIDNSERFVERVMEITHIAIERDYSIETFVSEGKKKRYFFRKFPREGQIKGDLVVRGYEFRRGDWITLTKDAEQLIMESILDTKGIDEALNIANKYVDILRRRTFSIDDVTIFKQLKKDISEYSVGHGQVHVAVAEKELTDYGVMPEVGEKSGVVIVNYDVVEKFYPHFCKKLSIDNLRSKVTSRAVLANRVTDVNDIDVDYYINNQLVKPLQRIFSIFGVQEKAITASEESLDNMRSVDIEALIGE